MMKTIKIIDLLIKIANGEEVPKKIKYCNKIYTLSNIVNDYMNEDGNYLTYKFDDFDILNDEVEILEEPKKIPEKLNIEQESIGSYYIKNEYGTKCYLTKHSKIFADKINEILDYLERKGK